MDSGNEEFISDTEESVGTISCHDFFSSTNQGRLVAYSDFVDFFTEVGDQRVNIFGMDSPSVGGHNQGNEQNGGINTPLGQCIVGSFTSAPSFSHNHLIDGTGMPQSYSVEFNNLNSYSPHSNPQDPVHTDPDHFSSSQFEGQACLPNVECHKVSLGVYSKIEGVAEEVERNIKGIDVFINKMGLKVFLLQWELCFNVGLHRGDCGQIK